MIQSLLNRAEHVEALDRLRVYYGSRLGLEAYLSRLFGIMERIPDKDVVVRFLENSLEDNPSPEIRFQLAALYRNDESYPEALAHSRVLVREQPEEHEFWSLHLYLLWEEQYKTELLSGLEEYCRRWPDDPERRLQLAQAYNWNEDYESEAATLEELLEQKPLRTDYSLMLARALNSRGLHFEAALKLDELVDRHPDSAGFRQALIETVLSLPESSEKDEFIVKLYEYSDGEDTEAAFMMASLAGRNEDHDRAQRIFRNLAAKNVDDPDLLIRVGEMGRSLGFEDLASDIYLRALSFDKSNHVALMGLAEISAAKAPDLAREYLNALDALSSDDAELAYRMALVYDAISDSVAAGRFYLRFLELESDAAMDKYSLRRKGWALYRGGEPEKALEVFQAIVRDYPGDRNLINDYAEILIELKQFEKALRELDKVKP